MAGAPADRIDRIECFQVRPRWLFVRIETAQGAVGWGEATLEGHAEAVAGAFETVCDRLIGHDPDRIEDAWQLLHRLGFYRGGPVMLSAIAGVDQALWDIKARKLAVAGFVWGAVAIWGLVKALRGHEPSKGRSGH